MVNYKRLRPPNEENTIHTRTLSSIQNESTHTPRDVNALINPSDSALLLLDHQPGLFQVVRDISVAELRANTAMLAKLATLMGLPVVTSALAPAGPNGPPMPEIRQFAPHAIYVPRKAEVNAWDNELFVEAVRKTRRKTLIMAGVWASVSLAFPALDANAAGFKVYAVLDASGDPSEIASRATLARLSQAGVVPTIAHAVLCELHRTWNRPDASELAKLYAMVAPNYVAVKEMSILDWQAQRLRY